MSGTKPLDEPAPDLGRHATEGGEAEGVVRPIRPVRTGIGAAGPCEKVRRVDDEEVETRRVSGEQPRRTAEQVPELVHLIRRA